MKMSVLREVYYWLFIDMALLYAFTGLLAAAATIKLVSPLLGRKGERATRGDKRLAAALGVLVPLCALALYLWLGRPDLPAMPRAWEDKGPNASVALLARKPLETLLLENPDDLDALMNLGALNERLGRYAEAAEFYEQAARVSPGNIMHRVIVVIHGEALVKAAGGRVTDQAAAVFARAIELNPGDPKSRFYLALKKDQEGDPDTAIAEWRQLLEDAPPRAYWTKMVRTELARALASRRQREK